VYEDMTRKHLKFLIAGVGGQGTILASDILSEVGIRFGCDVKKSDILGLAIRGGSVVSHIQWAEKVHAPMVDEGDADFLIGFEWLETLRRLSYVRPDGVIIANDHRIDPMSVSSGKEEYPPTSEVISLMEKAAKTVHVIAGTKTALDLGNARSFNVVLLGALSRIMDDQPVVWRDVIRELVPAKVAGLNQTAFNKGRSLVE
jgi:indolepyruvate ferredoxin oxidoreductase beta subunit